MKYLCDMFNLFCIILECLGETLFVQVSITGDGSHAAKIVGRGEINDYYKLVNIGTEAAVPADVKSSFSLLHDKIST